MTNVTHNFAAQADKYLHFQLNVFTAVCNDFFLFTSPTAPPKDRSLLVSKSLIYDQTLWKLISFPTAAAAVFSSN